ncbi:hypothetical protein BKI52_22985 [marine bacterium AO1-C]|nr:hypothetical protein BKI52_22985 [marine bacterium AO1-C]
MIYPYQRVEYCQKLAQASLLKTRFYTRENPLFVKKTLGIYLEMICLAKTFVLNLQTTIK